MSTEAIFFALFLLAWGVLLLFRRRCLARREVVVIDGSNVLHWYDGTPNLAPLRAVLAKLISERRYPIVWFDANAGYLIAGRYMGAAAFARTLRLPRKQIFVAPRGTPADPLILEAAAAHGARIITNDRYRDWRDTHPILNDPSLLIWGRWNDRGLFLRLDRGGASASSAASRRRAGRGGRRSNGP